MSKKKNNNKTTNTTAHITDITELVILLDRSGSMSGLEGDTIGGFNSLIEKQRAETEGTVLVTTVLFDNKYELLHDRVPIEKVPELTSREYYTRGMTALADAFGMTMGHIAALREKAGERVQKTLFVVITDGMENASREYSLEMVRKMIKQREGEGWEFLFIGADIDAAAAAATVGIRSANAVDFVHDGCGVDKVFASVSRAVSAARAASPMCFSRSMADCDWADEVRADFRARKHKK